MKRKGKKVIFSFIKVRMKRCQVTKFKQLLLASFNFMHYRISLSLSLKYNAYYI
jgi:hypothetical protein